MPSWSRDARALGASEMPAPMGVSFGERSRTRKGMLERRRMEARVRPPRPAPMIRMRVSVGETAIIAVV